MTNNMLSNSHAAAIFTAEKSPYISYISKIERAEAKVLERDLRAAAAVIKKRNTADLRYPCAVVECRDIEYHAAGKDNNALTCTPLMDEGLAVPKPETVAHFLNHLGDCRSNIHTRIIVLLGDRTFADGQAADGLLFCHILGTILDLSPVDVRFLAQLNTPTLYDAKKLQRPYELPMKPGFVSLGESTYGRSRGAAAYLGRRKLGNHSPHVGKSIPGSALGTEAERIQWLFGCRSAPISTSIFHGRRSVVSVSHLHIRNICLGSNRSEKVSLPGCYLPERSDTACGRGLH
jgi:hypothetical protein